MPRVRSASIDDEELLLELLNTTPVIDGSQQDQLEDRRHGREWLRQHDGQGTISELERIRKVRTALQGIVRGEESPTTLAPFVESIRYRPTVGNEGLVWTMQVPDDQRVAARAVLAWDDLRVRAPGRLRPCANDECQLYLIDRSKGNTARWCSMAVCGNRIKARRYYQRRRQLPDS